MAHSEDPPYLTVGTEVSAKYRGAFCEATIKTAKKLVRCKVSYGKGQSAIVTSDCIKGTLKIGGQVEVRQSDGQLQPATITKLTDQSTYTVVFDDGDERTLKRSSLCLKGGRHFHESESLDHLPLTDPENFGTPVMNTSSKKIGRKRRRGSHSPSSAGSASKRSCTYPSEFPVGKAVFLENDRRRSSWLPAVIVPAHYVLEASEMTPDTICLRSFKDGRYFAATKKELHDFSPDKEPLLSMLEGEIQAMYMCKPAIERAMAYIDTGELPWDMDLFDRSNPERSFPSRPMASDPSTSDEDDTQRQKEEESEAKAFEAELRQFHESRGTSMQRAPPTIVQQEVNLLQLYRLVKAVGGMDRVTQEMKWRSLYLQLGLPLNSSASYALRQTYRKYLYQFELHEKNKAKGGGTGAHKRLKPHPPPSSDEEQDDGKSQSTPDLQDKGKQQDRLKRLKQEDTSGVATPPGSVNGGRAMKTVKVEKLAVRQQPPPPVKLEEEEDEDEGESEGSDMECSSTPGMGEGWREELASRGDCQGSLSAGSLDRAELSASDTEGLEQCAGGYREGDRVLVFYGKGKSLRTYEAKVKEVDGGEEKTYLVHYNGWNSRYDEWIDSGRIAGKITGTSKTRPHFNTRKKAGKNSRSNSLFNTSKLPPGTLTSSNQLILSPSLQAIISSHAHPQPKPPKKDISKMHDGISGKTICGKEFSSKTPITVVTKNLSPKGLSSRGPISFVPCRLPTGPGIGTLSEASRERLSGGDTPTTNSSKPAAANGSKPASKGSSTKPQANKELTLDSSRTPAKASTVEPSSKKGSENKVSKTPEAKGSGKASEVKGPTKTPEPKALSKASEVKGSSKTPEPKGLSKASEVKGSSKTPEPKGLSKASEVKGSSKTSDTKGSGKTPEAKGSTKTPEAKGSSKAPEAKGTSKTPDAKGSSKTSEGRPAKTPEAKVTKSGEVKATKTPEDKASKTSDSSSKGSSKATNKGVDASSKGTSKMSEANSKALSKTQSDKKSSSDKSRGPAGTDTKGSVRLQGGKATKGKVAQDASDTTASEQSLPSTSTSSSASSSTSSEEDSEEDHDQPTPTHHQEDHPWNHTSSPLSTTPAHLPPIPTSTTPLMCSESLPAVPHASPPSSLSASSLSALTEPAHSLLSLSVSAGPFLTSPAKTPPSDPYQTTPPSGGKGDLGGVGVAKMDSMDSSSTSSGINSMDGLECAEERKSLDSASDRESSPLPTHHHTPSKRQMSSSPEGKRKWRGREMESEEDYQRRKKARHAEMNYSLDFSELPPMSSVERVNLIQQRLREVQQRWTDLKAEVAYIERKRRRAKRKEREAAQESSVQPHGPPPSSGDPTHLSSNPTTESQLHSVISCH